MNDYVRNLRLDSEQIFVINSYMREEKKIYNLHCYST